MSEVTLRFGPLNALGFNVQRSGVNWLCEDGHYCRPNEVIAYCNISLELAPGQRFVANPFPEERELQVAMAARMAGRLRISDAEPGGHLNVHGSLPWRSEDVLGFIDTAGDDPIARFDQMRIMLLAGRRTTALAAVEIGLLSGWHSRSRAWWSDEDGISGPTLLSMGICDCYGPVLGDRGAFTEMFEAASSPAQIVYVPDQPITPCAPFLAEQFTRTPEQLQAIAADLQLALSAGRTPVSAQDWLFAGTMLGVLGRSPMREKYNILTASGLQVAGPPEAIMLSLNAEFATLIRHKKLGYCLHIMRHHLNAAGPVIREWLANDFEIVQRRTADIKRDYERLFDLVSRETGARFLIVNRMSSSGQEDITNYAAFDSPMADTLQTIAAKELNLMLHDLVISHGIDIIDIDCLAGELGASAHLPDGTHQSGLMQQFVRMELLNCLT